MVPGEGGGRCQTSLYCAPLFSLPGPPPYPWSIPEGVRAVPVAKASPLGLCWQPEPSAAMAPPAGSGSVGEATGMSWAKKHGSEHASTCLQQSTVLRVWGWAAQACQRVGKGSSVRSPEEQLAMLLRCCSGCGELDGGRRVLYGLGAVALHKRSHGTPVDSHWPNGQGTFLKIAEIEKV